MIKQLVGIGGANADFMMHALSPVVMHDSNPGRFSMAPGGVMRNICENAARLGIETSIVTAVGKDAAGELIMSSLCEMGISDAYVHRLSDCPSSVYLSALDENGEMLVSFSDMTAAARLECADIDRALPAIEQADVVCMDANPSREFIEYAAKTISTFDVPIFLDPVSTAHTKKLSGLLGYFDTIKPNRLELAALSGCEIEREDDLPRAAAAVIDAGVRRVFVTLGTDGVYYLDRDGHEARFYSPSVAMKNANGAGDAFTAGLLSAYLDDLSVEDTFCRAAACAAIAVQSVEAVNPRMSFSRVNAAADDIKKYNFQIANNK